jgi:S1-C subfamily serine protease
MRRWFRFRWVLAVVSLVAVGLFIAFLPSLEVYANWGYAFVRAPRATWRSDGELRKLLDRANDPHNSALQRAVSYYLAGMMCDAGQGVPRDLARGHALCGRALEEFLKVEEKQNGPVATDSRATHKLAQQHELEEKQSGPVTTDGRARGGIERFCVNEFSYAQVMAGHIVFYGLGGRTNKVEGVGHYMRAAELGDPAGQLFLGMAYLYGDGVPKNEEIALRWIRASAEYGVGDAQMLLGEKLQGSSQAADKIDAYKWLNLAAAQGNEIAEKDRDELEKKLSGEQVARAQGLSMLFEPRMGLGGSVASSNSNSVASLAARWMSGTCFFISTTGYLVTSWHVVERGKQFFVIDESDLYVAKIVATDPTNDLALLQIDGRMTSWDLDNPSTFRLVDEVTNTFRPIPIRAEGVRLGEAVATVGFPNTQLQGFSPKVTRGDVSSLAGPGDDPRFFQVSVPVQPGNSGGPLLDSGGNVVGVICGQLLPSLALAEGGSLPQNVNYAMKGGLLMRLVETVPGLAGSLVEVNRSSEDFANMTASAVNSVAIILASDATPPLTGKKLKSTK